MRHHKATLSVVTKGAWRLIGLHRASDADQRFCGQRWLPAEWSALEVVSDSRWLQDLSPPLSFRLFMRLTSSIAECTSSLA